MNNVLGWLDSVNACDCCGKAPISGTFAVETENGDILYYGSTCVTKNTGKSHGDINNEMLKSLMSRVEQARLKYKQTGLEVEVETVRSEARKKGFSFGKKFKEYTEAVCSKDHAVKEHICNEYKIEEWMLSTNPEKINIFKQIF